MVIADAGDENSHGIRLKFSGRCVFHCLFILCPLLELELQYVIYIYICIIHSCMHRIDLNRNESQENLVVMVDEVQVAARRPLRNRYHWSNIVQPCSSRLSVCLTSQKETCSIDIKTLSIRYIDHFRPFLFPLFSCIL